MLVSVYTERYPDKSVRTEADKACRRQEHQVSTQYPQKLPGYNTFP